MTKTKKKRILISIASVVGALLLVTLIVFLASRPDRKIIDAPRSKKYTTVGDPISLNFECSDEDRYLDIMTSADGTSISIDQKTSGVIIHDSKTGNTYRSVPEDDISASSDILSSEMSSVIVKYYNVNGSEKSEKTMYSYDTATKKNQVKYYKLADDAGIRVQFSLGTVGGRSLMPEIMTAEFAEHIKELVGESNYKLMVKNAYTFVSKDSKSAENYISQGFTPLKNQDLWMFNTNTSPVNIAKVQNWLSSKSFTLEELMDFYSSVDYEPRMSESAYFVVNVDYVIDKQGEFVINVNTDTLEYNKDEFYMTTLTVLPYFGAGSIFEDGYMLFPDGSGSQVMLNSTSVGHQGISGNIYGYDACVSYSDTGLSQNQILAPVFGMKADGHSYFAVIENGDSLGRIVCQLAGDPRMALYSSIYSEYRIALLDSYLTNEGSTWKQIDKTGYQGDITIRYFLLDDSCNYSSMAGIYRNYLIDKGVLKKQQDVKQDIELFVDTLGVVGNYKKIMGIPVYKNVEVTTYEEALEIVKELKEAGLTNLALRYFNWCNGGAFNTPNTHMDMESAAGSKKELKELSSYMKDSGYDLFMDVNLFTAEELENIDFRYVSSSDGIRNLFQNLAFSKRVNPAIGLLTDWYYCINPSKMLSYYDTFSESYKKLDVENISLATAGSVLNSNYNKKDYISRQTSLEIVKELLKNANSDYNRVVVDNGNAYVYGNVDTIMSIPMSDSAWILEYRSVPFIQMVLHGYIDYAGNPLNLSSQYDKDVLKCIEYGALPHFELCKEEGSTIKNAYDILDVNYSLTYDDWKSKMIETYNTINTVLKKVQGAEIVDHKYFNDNVTLTEYSNGVQVYVNYGDTEYTCSDITVAPMSYTVLGGEG